jgi:hypothetical protein
MMRVLLAIGAFVLVAGVCWASQEQPAAKKADVVKDVERAFDEASARLEKDDAGKKTHAAHRRIIEGLDRLLNEDDPPAPPGAPPAGANPPPPGKSGESAPPPAGQQPQGSDAARPKGTGAAAGQPKSEPQANSKPSGGGVAPAPGAGPPSVPNADGPWETRRYRQRLGIDAAAREGYIRNYEELLQAYFRSLAAGRGDE